MQYPPSPLHQKNYSRKERDEESSQIAVAPPREFSSISLKFNLRLLWIGNVVGNESLKYDSVFYSK